MTNATPTVFLDTTALKFAAERIIRGRQRPVTTRWGDQTLTFNVTQFVEHFPNAYARPELQKEQRHLPLLAHLARKGRIRLVTHFEVYEEFWGLPKTDDSRGVFYGAPIERVNGPFEYSRIMCGWSPFPRDYQFEFLRGVSHPRYKQLQVAVGANEESRKFKNQLLDAFHICCAEAAKAEYFLTLDQKLIRHVSGHKRWPPTTRVLSPTELVKLLIRGRHVRFRDVLTYLRTERQARRKPPSGPYEDLVKLGKRREKRGYYDEK